MTQQLAYVPMGADTWTDPSALYEYLRDHEPVHQAPQGFWVLSRYQDVFEAARDTETFSSAQGLSFVNDVAELGLLPTIVMMDPPDHTRYRRLVARGFTPREVNEIELDLRAFVRARVDVLVRAGSGDFVAALAAPVPCYVVASYLGVDEHERARFAGWTEMIVQSAAGGHREGTDAALADLYGFFTEQIERRRREPSGDMISLLLAAGPEEVGLSAEEILGYMFVMIAGGNDTAIGLLAGGVELLAGNPDQREMLIDDPSLIPNAVEELLRLTSPVQGLCRVTTRDVTLHGTDIPAGSRVLLCFGSANRDPREFGPTAGALDVHRDIATHVALGSGAHFCLGASVARLQGRVVLEELLDRCPDYTVDSGAARYADGPFTRRHERLPFRAGGVSEVAGI